MPAASARQRIWSTSAVISAVLLVLLAILWAISQRNFIALEHRSFDPAINCDRGFILFCTDGWIEFERWVQNYTGSAPPTPMVRWSFHVDPRSSPSPSSLGWWYVGLQNTAHLPISLLMLLAAVLPATRVPNVIAWFRARSRRKHGLCPSCGYDLRATPGRCPECGHESLIT